MLLDCRSDWRLWPRGPVVMLPWHARLPIVYESYAAPTIQVPVSSVIWEKQVSWMERRERKEFLEILRWRAGIEQLVLILGSPR